MLQPRHLAAQILAPTSTPEWLQPNHSLAFHSRDVGILLFIYGRNQALLVAS